MAVVLAAIGVGDRVSDVVRDIAVAAYALRLRGMELRLVALSDAAGERPVTKTAAEYGLSTTFQRASDIGEAYRSGIRLALAQDNVDLVVTLDGTGQHDATQLPSLLDRMLTRKLDMIIGSRWVRDSGTPGLSLSKWMLGRLANRTFRTITGVRGITDVTTAFRVAKARLLDRMDLDSLPQDPRALQMAVVANAIALGYRVGESPIIYHGNRGQAAAVGLREIKEFAQYLPRLRAQSRAIRRHRLSPQGRQFTNAEFGAAADLERLGTADHFFGWTLEEFKPYLNGRVLEVGAGLGTITRKLTELDESLKIVALEPAANLFGELMAYAALTPRVTASQLTSGQYTATDCDPFDVVMYLNVLEHIEDDVKELKIAAEALRPGGYVLIFGPGLKWLYSELDYNAGHYRRYTINGLRDVAQSTGLEVVSLRYFDVLGVLPYYIVYRLMRRQAISGSTMWGYDKLLVPLSRAIQTLIRRPPFGKNVIMVARKP